MDREEREREHGARTVDDPQFDELDRDLRRQLDAEFRAEAEESERLAAQAARRQRTLADVARDAMARGDLVAADIAARTFSGTVLLAGTDFVSLATVAGRVDVRLSAPALVMHITRRPAAVGRDRRSGPETFRARLLELELAGAVVEVGLATPGSERVGPLATVAADHLVLHGDVGEVFVSLAAVVWVRERSGRP